jgi:hypothetical protein
VTWLLDHSLLLLPVWNLMSQLIWMIKCQYDPNYRIITVNTIQCHSIAPLHVSVSWPSSQGLISTYLGTTVTWFVIHTWSYYIKVIYNCLEVCITNHVMPASRRCSPGWPLASSTTSLHLVLGYWTKLFFTGWGC